MGEIDCVKLYTFLDPHSHGIDWSEIDVYIVQNEVGATSALEALKRSKKVYVDCEGENFGNVNAKIGLIQIFQKIYSLDICFLFDVKTCPGILSVIKELMESENICKVFHDCSGDVAALEAASLSGKERIQVENVGDTQVAQKIIDSSKSDCVIKEYPLDQLYKHVFEFEVFPKVKTKSYMSNKWLDKRPMSEDMIKYAVADVMMLPRIYEWQMNQMTLTQKDRYFSDVEKKLSYKRKSIHAQDAVDVPESTAVSPFVQFPFEDVVHTTRPVIPESTARSPFVQFPFDDVVHTTRPVIPESTARAPFVQFPSEDVVYTTRRVRRIQRVRVEEEDIDLSGVGTMLAVGAVAALGIGALAFLASTNRNRK